MYIDLDPPNKLQPFVEFDWRLVAERGLRCYGHFHAAERKTVATCEIAFLQKSAREDQEARNHQLGAPAAGSSATKRAGQFKCVGAIRKSGFLSVKKWILRRRQSIELARKQGWKRYWVCLRGTALLFHSVLEGAREPPAEHEAQVVDLLSWLDANCAGQAEAAASLLQSETRARQKPAAVSSPVPEEFLRGMARCFIEKEPRHLILVDGAIAQPVPEHPRREFVFCLSTSFGDAYLFQASCQLESDNWTAAIHNACAASIARDLTRDEAAKLFETKLRHLELEAEKKLFLRQRLESRLTSMSSMSHISSRELALHLERLQQQQQQQQQETADSGKVTMRLLMCRLNQQLLALDTHLEQVHCEIYQIRCYLASCAAQHSFYRSGGQNAAPVELPHPKSLLAHVSRPTKLLLIRLGVLTVSSFHAYTHARRESAHGILQRIRQSALPVGGESLELRVPASRSLSEPSIEQKLDAELEASAEQLIRISDLRTVGVQLSKDLCTRIRGREDVQRLRSASSDDTSDDRYSIRECARDSLLVNLKLHSDSSASSVIKQVLRILAPAASEFQYLDYYIVSATPDQESGDGAQPEYVAKRRDALSDLSGADRFELREKIVFRVDLVRRRVDEGVVPFGISVEAQLVSGEADSQLCVFCGYVEWGSVADRAGLRDDDELLMIDGVPVRDLDMMFVECLVQDNSELRLIVRSSRAECPPGATLLNKSTWRPADEDGPSGGGKPRELGAASSTPSALGDPHAGSQVISDEYVSSLVCPPPPTRSSAFLRTDSFLLRQKSDLQDSKFRSEPGDEQTLPKTVSYYTLDAPTEGRGDEQANERTTRAADDLASSQLASQLLIKSQQLTESLDVRHQKPLGAIAGKQDQSLTPESERGQGEERPNAVIPADANVVERLRKSILELLETEYAYIKHLETIDEHYMNPLQEMSFLKIAQLRQLSQNILDLTRLQRDFFGQLTRSMIASCQIDVSSAAGNDEFDELNLIITQLESFRNYSDFKPIVQALASTFLDEADNFKKYAPYCIAYSKLQKLLHPRRTSGSPSQPSISLMPPTLNTFHSSGSIPTLAAAGLPASSGKGSQQHRDYLRPLMFGVGGEQNPQLRLLNDFLGNLDSSSSSASLSLQKSSSPEPSSNEANSQRPGTSKSFAATRSIGSLQKSVPQQNFESYLIKPIQRIVKYPMLLNSIAMSLSQLSPGDDDSPLADVQLAIRSMESVIGHVNNAQCLHDEYGDIFDTIESQFHEQQAELAAKTNAPSPLTGPHQPPISLGIGQLLYYNTVEWLNINKFAPKLKRGANLNHVLFVFSSCCVFICKEQIKPTKKRLPSSWGVQTHSSSTQQTSSKSFLRSASSTDFYEVIRFQCLFPSSTVQVRPVSSAEAATKPSDLFEWELIQCSSSESNSSLLTKSAKGTERQRGKIYLLGCQSNEVRNMFLRRIRFTIRESVRNMSLPLARSPSSKSAPTSKKLSSPSSGTNTNSTCSHSNSLSPVFDGAETHKQIKVKPEKHYMSSVDNGFSAGIKVNN